MASNNSLLTFPPQSNEAPASAYMTLDTRNGHPVLDADAGVDESACFRAVMPRHYAGGGITVSLHVSFSSATSGVARFDVAFERIGDGQQDVDSDGFATAKSVDVTAPGTSGHVEVADVAFANSEIDGVLIGELFRVKVTRDADHSNDTATGDAEIHAVALRET